MSRNIYQEVTDRIIAQLEQGAAPWIKPWSATNVQGGADINAVSRKPYRGINRVLLAMSGFGSNRWATFKQWQELGGTVRKGEKGTHITFFKPTTWTKTSEGGDEEERSGVILRDFVVFNADQIDGIETPEAVVRPPAERDEACEATIHATEADIQYGGDKAFFAPSMDIIKVPHIETFKTREHFYATVFHELVHWTGADHRLDRNQLGRFGSSDYAFEELVAEIGAAMLCSDHGLQGDLRHAGYIQSWLKCLKDNNRAIFKAAALAEKAAQYVNQPAVARQQEEALA